MRPSLKHDTGFHWTHSWQRCHSSSGWGWSGRQYLHWPLWEGKASWWRGSWPNSLLRSCLGHRPKPACGLQRINREWIILWRPSVTFFFYSKHQPFCYFIIIPAHLPHLQPWLLLLCSATPALQWPGLSLLRCEGACMRQIILVPLEHLVRTATMLKIHMQYYWSQWQASQNC